MKAFCLKLHAAPVSPSEKVKAALAISAIFAILFYPTDWVARTIPVHHRVDFTWENDIPYIPFFFVIYYSVAVAPILCVARCTSLKDLGSFKSDMIVAIALAAVAFVLFPVTAGYAVRSASPFLKLNDFIAGRHNYVPSLHVCLSLISIIHLWKNMSRKGRRIAILWLVLLIASTLFTHQHHVVDIVAAILLATCVTKIKLSPQSTIL